MSATVSTPSTRALRAAVVPRLLLTLALLAGVHAQAHQIRSDWIMQDNDYVMAFVNVTYHDPTTNKPLYHSGEIGKYSSGLVAVAAGRLVHVRARADNDTVHDGCDWPWENAVWDEPWIALVRHGRCSADVKVENAYRANASAVVVYDHQPGGLLQRLHLNCEHRDAIVTVFFRKEQGDELATLVDKGFDISMQLTPGKRVTFSVEKLNRTSVLFVSMSFILLLVISLAWLLFYYVQRFRYMHAKDRLARHLVSAARKALSRVPLRTLKVDDEQLEDTECCAVCLETYRATECVRMLPCSHQFHMVCVDPWLLKNRSCPMCKMDILKYYGMTVVTGEEGQLQAGSPRESSSPDPAAIATPSGGSSPQHSNSGHAASSAAPTVVRIDGRLPGEPAGSSTCTNAGGSTCGNGARQASIVDDTAEVPLRCTELADEAPRSPVITAAATAAAAAAAASAAAAVAVASASPSCSGSASGPLAEVMSVSNCSDSPSVFDRRLSLHDDDEVSFSGSGGTFQSCHQASCESFTSGSPDGSPVAGRAARRSADIAVVHIGDEDEERA